MSKVLLLTLDPLFLQHFYCFGKKIPNAQIAGQIGKKQFNDKMFDLVIACLADHVFSIRDAACKTLQQIVDIFGLDWAKASGLTLF